MGQKHRRKMKIKKSAIIYWWKMRPIKKEYKRIGKELDKIDKELKQMHVTIGQLTGGVCDPPPAGSGLGITKEKHVANIS
jgi:hypothetical protein